MENKAEIMLFSVPISNPNPTLNPACLKCDCYNMTGSNCRRDN